jgi:hypothetical protein
MSGRNVPPKRTKTADVVKTAVTNIVMTAVAIQLHVPRVYYAVKGGNKQEVPLPLDTETMARIPEPKYYTNNDRTTFALLSIYFIMTLDYHNVIQRTIKKRIQLLQEQPQQSHPIDRILTQFKMTGVSRQTQLTPEDTQTKDDNIKKHTNKSSKTSKRKFKSNKKENN